MYGRLISSHHDDNGCIARTAGQGTSHECECSWGAFQSAMEDRCHSWVECRCGHFRGLLSDYALSIKWAVPTSICASFKRNLAAQTPSSTIPCSVLPRRRWQKRGWHVLPFDLSRYIVKVHFIISHLIGCYMCCRNTIFASKNVGVFVVTRYWRLFCFCFVSHLSTSNMM